MKINSSDSDFLYEVSALPAYIRDCYIKSLIRGGNLKGQKNFLFASYVEKIVCSDINEWDREKIIRVLKISTKMFACYKSRMLKNLREKYFTLKKEKNENSFDFAKRLSRCGMNRETRSIFLKLSAEYQKEISEKNFSNISNLSSIYSWFTLYYLNLKNYKRFSFYRKKLLLLKKYLYKVNSKSKSALKSDIYKTESYKHVFRLSTQKAQKISVQLKLKALAEAKKIKDKESILLLLLQIGINYKLNKNSGEAEKFLNAGVKFSEKINSPEDSIPFNIQLGEIAFNRDNSRANDYHDTLKLYIRNFTLGKSPAAIMQYSLFSLLKTSGFLNLDDELQKFEKDYCNWLFVTAKRYESSLRSKAQEIIWIGWNMIEWHREKNHYKVDINKQKLQQYFSTIGAYLTLSKRVYNINRLTLIYNYQADAELYRGRDCNFAAAEVFINKLERIYKTRKMQIPESWFALNRVLIKMLEESAYTDNEKVFHKHALEIKRIIEVMKSKDYKYNVLSDYSKLNFTANILKVAAFSNEVYAFEDWLAENRPNLFTPLNLISDDLVLRHTA